MGRLFEEVLLAMHQHEEEDGIHDLWRRTIMKFYSKVIGDRDYSLFETVHFGLRLPATLSSLPDPVSVSVSDWASLKTQNREKRLHQENVSRIYRKRKSLTGEAIYRGVDTYPTTNSAILAFSRSGVFLITMMGN